MLVSKTKSPINTKTPYSRIVFGVQLRGSTRRINEGVSARQGNSARTSSVRALKSNTVERRVRWARPNNDDRCAGSEGIATRGSARGKWLKQDCGSLANTKRPISLSVRHRPGARAQSGTAELTARLGQTAGLVEMAIKPTTKASGLKGRFAGFDNARNASNIPGSFRTECYTAFQIDRRGCCDKRFRRSRLGGCPSWALNRARDTVADGAEAMPGASEGGVLILWGEGYLVVTCRTIGKKRKEKTRKEQAQKQHPEERQ